MGVELAGQRGGQRLGPLGHGELAGGELEHEAARSARPPRARRSAASPRAARRARRTSRSWRTAGPRPRRPRRGGSRRRCRVRRSRRAWRAGSPRAWPRRAVRSGTFVPSAGTNVPWLSGGRDDHRRPFPAGQHQLRGPLRALGARQLEGLRDRLLGRSRAVAEPVLRPRARRRPLELLALLLGRGRRDRRPLALHRRRAARGAEVLPRHPAGGRGAPRRLLQALHGGGRGHRRHAPATRSRRSARSSPGASSRCSTGSSACRTSCGAIARSPSSPRRSRSTTSSSRPRSPSRASTSSPATSRTASCSPGFREGMENVAQDEQRHIGFGVKMLSDLRRWIRRRAGGRGRPAARGDPVDGLRADPAELGRALHRVLRLHDGGHRRGGRHLARDQDAHRRHADRGPAGAAGVPDPGHPARARGHRQADGAGRLPRREGRAALDRRATTCACCSTRWPPASTSSQAPEPGTIQWDFPDAEPWHVVVANGSTRAEPGRAPRRHGDAAHPLRGLRGRHLRAAWTRAAWRCAGACAPRATCAGSGARAGCSPRRGPSGRRAATVRH